MFASSCERQHDRHGAGVQPEAVGEKGQQGYSEPQVTSPLEVAGWDQVCGWPARKDENDASQKQNDDKRTKMFRHWRWAPVPWWMTASIMAN
ncbi:hypothetical protein D3C84_863270 [compost metagenome]